MKVPVICVNGVRDRWRGLDAIDTIWTRSRRDLGPISSPSRLQHGEQVGRRRLAQRPVVEEKPVSVDLHVAAAERANAHLRPGRR